MHFVERWINPTGYDGGIVLNFENQDKGPWKYISVYYKRYWWPALVQAGAAKGSARGRAQRAKNPS
jgi:hypothetical protein